MELLEKEKEGEKLDLLCRAVDVLQNLVGVTMSKWKPFAMKKLKIYRLGPVYVRVFIRQESHPEMNSSQYLVISLLLLT